MSYFVGGYKMEEKDIKGLQELMLDVVPVDKKSSSLRLGGVVSNFTSYGVEKAIPHVAIRGQDTDSWLIVAGTPLIRLNDKLHEKLFLDAFLSSPKEFLRNKIDGNFALFCYDANKGRFIMATDFENTTPIFYALRQNGVYFSSHELVLAKFLNAEIDPYGFAQTIQLGFTWKTRTRFKEIFKMVPCQMLIVDEDKKILADHYWTPNEEKPLQYTFDDLIENFISSLKKSIWGFFESAGSKPIISDLTGGEDTRLLVAQCHSLKIPFRAHVVGLGNNSDVVVAKRAAAVTGMDLIVRQQKWPSEEELIENVRSIVLSSDAYHAFVDSCVEFATDMADPLDDYENVKLCGVGGGTFRGTQYLRGKVIFPSRRSNLDYKFFTKLNFLLDYRPNLLNFPDESFIESIYSVVREGLNEVEGFPVGIQIDHLERVFNDCSLGMRYKAPLYLPYMTRDLTRALYYISPRHRSGGKLTRACTEILFPELAFINTQKGVPTIRMTPTRTLRFLPEYLNLIKSIKSGVTGRLFKWSNPRPLLSFEKSSYIFESIFSKMPYRDWFLSSDSMITGWLYKAEELNSILDQVRTGNCRYVAVLGRIINIELACRWVYGRGL